MAVKRIDTFLELVLQQQGSDLHLIAGQTPRIRLHGDLFAVKYRTLSADETEALIYDTMPSSLRQLFATRSSLDFAYESAELGRFRVNVFRHLTGLGAVFRVIPKTVQTLDALGLPAALTSLCQERHGLILVTGPTGSGKSTTLAAMIDCINRHRHGHIVTIEDPIEFVHTNDCCLMSQREVGSHTPNFAAALHSALREDPDVILVGELRDLETIRLAVTAAETGVLIFATLHTNSAVATVDRMISVFTGHEQARVRNQLATSLCGVIAQQLVRRADRKGRLAVQEILLNTTAVANLIREGKTHQLPGVVERGALVGMQSFDRALRALLDVKQITGAEAHRHATHKQDFEQFLESAQPAKRLTVQVDSHQ